MRELYETNETFREYVDKYATSREISVAEALTHKLVIQYGEDIKKNERADWTGGVSSRVGAADGETD